ncbi:MAG TPA: pyridine nucleotide-disulfide oxidoreductase [Sedimenticola thiotaurini]|uniref:Pyridine nucleotide-disulfide oxidoreductase n=1 Tax=Sedimenticola thiotaurini TaxID=1543721 RepID=A0A831W3R7_9GAMM|nr:pyridine nucleotide-disulfide oxidoreductase [Sedimenticola thiotaurini]
MDGRRITLLLLVLAAVTAFFWFDVGSWLTLENLKARQGELQAWQAANPWLSAGIAFLVYVLVTALSLPGATVMTLAIGAVFGLWKGLVLVSFASTIGATLAFLLARFLLRDWVQGRFGDKLKAINEGIEKDGAFYLFGLRLVPLFPFFVINLVMGLTPMRTWTYAWVSQLGMLAGTFVYVNAGTQLGRLESLSGILSPQLILSFALLGVFPLVARRLLAWLRGRKALSGYPRPRRFDRNLVVIGAGSGGLVAALIAAAVKARVTLIEKHRMGGDCLNTGCVPSKALIRSARFLARVRRHRDYGIRSAGADFDFAEVMERVQGVVKQVEPHDSVERFEGLGVDVIQGTARIVSPWEVEVNGERLTTRNMVIATGARPLVPPIPGLEGIDYLTSDDLWQLRELPRRLLVLGGGPIGCELAQAFARFGAEVTIVEMAPRLLVREDEDVSALVTERFLEEGIRLLVGHTAAAFRTTDHGHELVARSAGEEVTVAFDRVLVAVGRVANTEGFGLEELGVRLTGRRTIETDEFLQTSIPTIYACGDVVGPYQFTHTASHQAWYATVNALFGGFRRFKVDYSVIPFATFVDPEVARVGLNEQEAVQQGIPYEVTLYGLDDLDRAIADGEAYGFVKVLTVPGKDRILGATIVGEHAGDLIAEFVTAMRHGLGLNRILGTIHIYPTWTEANKFAAGNWKRAHAPRTLLKWVEGYHRWRRGGGEGSG